MADASDTIKRVRDPDQDDSTPFALASEDSGPAKKVCLGLAGSSKSSEASLQCCDDTLNVKDTVIVESGKSLNEVDMDNVSKDEVIVESSKSLNEADVDNVSKDMVIVQSTRSLNEADTDNVFKDESTRPLTEADMDNVSKDTAIVESFRPLNEADMDNVSKDMIIAESTRPLNEADITDCVRKEQAAVIVDGTVHLFCDVCKRHCKNEEAFKHHLLGARHAKNLKRLSTTGPTICELCSIKCDSEIALQQHLLGRKHVRKLSLKAAPEEFHQSSGELKVESLEGGGLSSKVSAEELHQSHGVMEDERAENGYFCDLCKVKCGSKKGLEQHFLGRKHLRTLSAKASAEELCQSNGATDERAENRGNQDFCDSCQAKDSSKRSLEQHLRAGRHFWTVSSKAAGEELHQSNRELKDKIIANGRTEATGHDPALLISRPEIAKDQSGKGIEFGKTDLEGSYQSMHAVEVMCMDNSESPPYVGKLNNETRAALQNGTIGISPNKGAHEGVVLHTASALFGRLENQLVYDMCGAVCDKIPEDDAFVIMHAGCFLNLLKKISS